MAEARLSPLAESDLEEIWLHIAGDKPSAADRFLDLLVDKCETLAANPALGRRREELAAGLRSFPVGRYLIFFREIPKGVEIARILSAYRDIDALFEAGSFGDPRD